MPVSQSFPERGLIWILQKLLLEGQAFNLAHICDSLQRPGMYMKLPLPFPSSPLQVTSSSLEGASIHVLCPGFCCCHLRKSPPDHLALTALGLIQEPQRTVASKRFLMGSEAPSYSCTSRLRAEGTGKNAYFTVSPWKGPNYLFSKLLPEGPASNWPACRC